MMNKKDIPVKVLALQLKDPDLLHDCYMPFLEYGGLFMSTGDVFSLGEDILLAVETADYPKHFLLTKVVWINPTHTSAHRPKGVDLAFSEYESCQQAENLIEAELGSRLRSDRTIFTL